MQLHYRQWYLPLELPCKEINRVNVNERKRYRTGKWEQQYDPECPERGSEAKTEQEREAEKRWMCHHQVKHFMSTQFWTVLDMKSFMSTQEIMADGLKVFFDSAHFNVTFLGGSSNCLNISTGSRQELGELRDKCLKTVACQFSFWYDWERKRKEFFYPFPSVHKWVPTKTTFESLCYILKQNILSLPPLHVAALTLSAHFKRGHQLHKKMGSTWNQRLIQVEAWSGPVFTKIINIITIKLIIINIVWFSFSRNISVVQENHKIQANWSSYKQCYQKASFLVESNLRKWIQKSWTTEAKLNKLEKTTERKNKDKFSISK